MTLAPPASRRTFRLSGNSVLLIIGLLLLVVPTILRLADQFWSTEEGVHGPIVLATGSWLIWRRWDAIRANAVPGNSFLAWFGLTGSLLVYIFGRSFDFLSLEVAALLGVMLAVAYSFIGFRVLQSLWFPIFYALFLVPMPGWFVDYITAPLKEFVSYAAEGVLSWAGYAIVRQGVVLYIDQYQLLVEDACAGLNSIFSLTSISLFYIYLRHNASWRYAFFLVLWIIPIAVLANVIRVIVLVLITHYWGEEAAQGFLHTGAGMLMFTVALLGIMALDTLIEFTLSKKRVAR